MPGEADPVALEADTLGNLEEDEGERDGDAEAALDDAVDVAVLRVGVVLAIAPKAEGLEQLVRDGGDQLLGPRAFATTSANGLGDEIELAGEGRGVDLVAPEAGDRDRAAEEVDLLVAANDRLRKIAFGGTCQRPLRIATRGARSQRSGGGAGLTGGSAVRVGGMRLWQAMRSWLRGAPHALGLSIFSAQVALGIVIFALFQEFVPNNLGASDGFGGYLLALYGGARFLSETPAGAISDRIERKYALLLGFALMIPPLALMGFLQQEWAYLGFAALLGVSTAFIWPATYAIAADLYPPVERGKVVGFLNVGQLLGFGLGALVGALLVETAPNSLFIIAVVAVVGALIIGQTGVPSYRRELGALHEQRPPLRSVVSKQMVFLSVLILSATVGVSSLVPAVRPYGDDVLNISFAQLTVFLIPAVLAGGILYVPSGHLSDRIGRTIPLLLGQFLIIAGALTAAATGNILLAASATAVIFCGHVQQVPALNASMMDLAPESYRGTLIGWSVALSGLGLAVGPALGGAVVDAYDAPMAFQTGAMVAGFTALLTIAYGLVYGYARPTPIAPADAEAGPAES